MISLKPAFCFLFLYLFCAVLLVQASGVTAPRPATQNNPHFFQRAETPGAVRRTDPDVVETVPEKTTSSTTVVHEAPTALPQTPGRPVFHSTSLNRVFSGTKDNAPVAKVLAMYSFISGMVATGIIISMFFWTSVSGFLLWTALIIAISLLGFILGLFSIKNGLSKQSGLWKTIGILGMVVNISWLILGFMIISIAGLIYLAA